MTPLAACDAHRDALVAPSQAGHTHHVTEPPLPTTDDNMSVGLGTIETNEPSSNSFVRKVVLDNLVLATTSP